MSRDHLLQPLKAVVYGRLVKGYNRTQRQRSVSDARAVGTRAWHAPGGTRSPPSPTLRGPGTRALLLPEGTGPPFLSHVQAMIISNL